MFFFNRKRFILWLSMFLTSISGHCDVLINVDAIMVSPSCSVQAENGADELNIKFGSLNIDDLNTEKSKKNFYIYITDCDFTRNITMTLNPKGSSTANYEGRNILSTTNKYVGIDISELTSSSIRPLNFNIKERITPKPINYNKYRVELEANLVNLNDFSLITPGKFSAALTLFLTYE